MKEQEEINYINSHKRLAKEVNPDSMVVESYRAKAAIERAYQKGFRDGKSFNTAIL